MVRSQDIRSGVFRYETAGRVTESTYRERIARAEPMFGDVLFSREGTYFGIAAEMPRDMQVCLGQRMVLIRPNPSLLDTRYLRYWINSPKMVAHVAGFRDGSVAERLNMPTIRALPIGFRSLAEQRAIAGVLGALDDKIEANRRMNATLESLSRAIYDSTIADDFSEVVLGDICEVFDGPHATPRTTDDGPIFLGISNLIDGQLDLSDTRHVTEEDYARWTRRVTPSSGDILFSYETRLGQAAWLPAGIRCCLGRRMGILRARPNKTPAIALFHAYLSNAFQETIREKTVHGSTVERIPLIEMPSFPIRLPTAERCDVLAPALLAMRDRICLNAALNRTLAQLRDLLIPKLLSGALRVQDAEAMVEDAA